jgi:hypothetical protein
MVWGFCYLRIFKKMHSISGRSLQSIPLNMQTRVIKELHTVVDKMNWDNVFSLM